MHAPYCHLWPVRPRTIFPHYLIKDTSLEKKLLNIKCIFIISLNLSETFPTLRRIERDRIKSLFWYLCKVPVILVRFGGNLNFSTNFRKKLNIKFNEIPSSGSRVVLCGRTDIRREGHDEDNGLFSQFCERS